MYEFIQTYSQFFLKNSVKFKEPEREMEKEPGKKREIKNDKKPISYSHTNTNFNYEQNFNYEPNFENDIQEYINSKNQYQKIDESKLLSLKKSLFRTHLI